MDKKTLFILNAKKNGWKIKRKTSKTYVFIKKLCSEHYSCNYLNKFLYQNLIK